MTDRIEVRKGFFGGWMWTCPVCHYGDDIPWEDADGWPDALVATWEHIADHRMTGRALEPQWIPLSMSRP